MSVRRSSVVACSSVDKVQPRAWGAAEVPWLVVVLHAGLKGIAGIKQVAKVG